MSITSDQPPVEARGKVLEFRPATGSVARTRWSNATKYGLAGVAALLAIIGGIAGLLAIGGRSTMKYVSVPVGRGVIVRTVTATGTVNPKTTVFVASQVSGIIQNLSCDYNTEVKAGQVCARIDPRPYQATLDRYLGQLQRDQATLDKDRADLERYQRIRAKNSIARRQAEDQTHVVEQDEGTVKLDQALVDAARLDLGHTDIVSPIDGTVVSRNVAEGQAVAANSQGSALFLIAADLKNIQVDTSTSERDIGEVKAADRASFTVATFPRRSFEGRVSQVRQSPQTAANVVTYDAVIGIDNSDLALKPGMTASTRIIVDQRTDVLRVPSQALRYVPNDLSGGETQGVGSPPPNGQARIFLLRDGKPLAVNVETGLADDSFTEIVRGDIHDGDAVVTAESRSDTGLQVVSPPRP